MYIISSMLCGLKAAGMRTWLAVCFIVGISMVPAAIMVDAFNDCAILCDGRMSSLHRLRQPIAVGITMVIWLIVVLRLVRPLITGLCVCVGIQCGHRKFPNVRVLIQSLLTCSKSQLSSWTLVLLHLSVWPA